jgi:hypothetical protein
MSSMLRKTDSVFGHVIDDTPAGPVYRDDGSPVDFKNPRPCLGCKAACREGEHDPCIANLPGVLNACCGHGLDQSPNGGPNGYVAFKSGRTIRFSGCFGGERIREMVDSLLAGGELPDGVAQDKDRMWWEGLSDAQRAYVQERISDGIARIVREVTNGEHSCEQFLQGVQPWWEGLGEDHKAQVWARLGGMLIALREEALASVA